MLCRDQQAGPSITVQTPASAFSNAAASNQQKPVSPHRPPLDRAHSRSLSRATSNRQPPPSPSRPPPDRSPPSPLSRAPSASFSRAPSYPLARNSSSASLGSAMGSPHYTTYGISPVSHPHPNLPHYTGFNPHVNPLQPHAHQFSSPAQLPPAGQQPVTDMLHQQAAQPRLAPSSRRNIPGSASHAMPHSTPVSRSLLASPILQSGSSPGSGEGVGGPGGKTGLVAGSGVLDSMAQGSVGAQGGSQSGMRSSGLPRSTATTWLHSHSAHQVTADVKALAAQVALPSPCI